MLGDDVLVAPVLEPRVDTWPVYLPGTLDTVSQDELKHHQLYPKLTVQVTWVHLWTGEEAAGGHTVTVPAPLGQPPVFYRKGSKWSQLFQDIGNTFG